jgi:hypothetical protein
VRHLKEISEKKLMPLREMSDEMHKEIIASTLREMEELGRQMRDLIMTQPPKDLLGYIYAQDLLYTNSDPRKQSQYIRDNNTEDLINDRQIVLEYVHAVLAATEAQEEASLNESTCAKLFECAQKLRTAAMFHSMATSAATQNGVFGPRTADVEFQAKAAWVALRGNRYQVLEGEFYAFVLAPHDAVLRETYGLGAAEIAAGFQRMADAVRTGQAAAFEEMTRLFDAAQAYAAGQKKPLDETTLEWMGSHPSIGTTAARAFDDMLRGGICNVSRHAALPPALLADLAFERGAETDFFAPGPYCGTPFRTLPARRKPLIKLDGDYYGIDPCFIRDAGYRALLWNLLRGKPEYKKEFEARQKSMSEAAFFEIFGRQLEGATVYQEVYYKDPKNRQWAENDTLIIIDDVLVLVEAKAGAAATIASPALDFGRHVQAVQDLVIKAYKQCKRFFEYLASDEEVPIFKRERGQYTECARLRRSNYRLMLPIGLTVESFSPFSTMCKELPEITPLLRKHPFISLSIDDIFALKRFLQTPGEMMHYFEVRQAVAGIKNAHLFDEMDHLGAYITKNRVDYEINSELQKGKLDFIMWDGMSHVVDRYFESEDWDQTPAPKQEFPTEVANLLLALNRTRAPGWLAADSHIRNYDKEGRNALAKLLAACRATLANSPSRHFSKIGGQSLFVWLQRAGVPLDLHLVRDKARATAVATYTRDMIAIFVTADSAGGYLTATPIKFDIPHARTAANAHIFQDAEVIRRRAAQARPLPHRGQGPLKRLGRNEPCWCGSNLKFKKCHGRWAHEAP